MRYGLVTADGSGGVIVASILRTLYWPTSSGQTDEQFTLLSYGLYYLRCPYQ